jgi:4-amino-4-deoxy-L-arabinose transferase-like glycosyltransferase
MPFESLTMRQGHVLVLVLGLALALRLGAGVYVQTLVESTAPVGEDGGSAFLFPDSANMHATAVNLAAGRGHVDEAGRHAWRMPLYQIVLAALHWAGIRSPAGIRLLQGFLGTLNCLLIFAVAQRWFNPRAGLWAAAMAALYPFLIFFANLVLTETLSITLLLVALLAQERLVAMRTAPAALAAGLALGLLTLTKATFGLLPLAMAAYWLLVLRPVRWRRRSVLALWMLLGAALVLSPWWYRNYRVFGAFVPFATKGGVALYESCSPQADGGPNFGRIDFPPGTESMDELERDRALRRAAWAWMRDNPGRVLSLAGRKLARTWSPVPNWRGAQDWTYRLATALSYIPVMLLAVYGLWRTRRQWRAAWLPLVPVLYIAAVHTIFLGSIRYRLPAMACLLILAGVGAEQLVRRLRAPRRRGA